MQEHSEKNDKTKIKIFSTYIRRHQRMPDLKKFKTAKDTLYFLKTHSREYQHHLLSLKMLEKLKRQSFSQLDDSFDMKNQEELEKSKVFDQKHAKTKLDFLFYTKAIGIFMSGENKVWYQ